MFLIAAKSIDKPNTIKKIMMKKSLIGAILADIEYRYGKFARATPDKKAPISNEKPENLKILETPRAQAMVHKKRSSEFEAT